MINFLKPIKVRHQSLTFLIIIISQHILVTNYSGYEAQLIIRLGGLRNIKTLIVFYQISMSIKK